MYKPEYMQRVRAKRRAEGLCPTCGGIREDEDRVNCRECRESGTKRKQLSRKRAKKNKEEKK
jgi:uncharacterized membrane protein YvbJ